jgi:DNA-binding winged helix-turn-helix (wHTH) protein
MVRGSNMGTRNWKLWRNGGDSPVFAVQYRFEAIVVDADRRQLLRTGDEVHLSPKAFELLLFLLHRRPKAVSKAELMAHLWPDTFVADATLTSLVADVRDAIGDTGRLPRVIRTLHRFGYSFAAEISNSTTGGRLVATATSPCKHRPGQARPRRLAHLLIWWPGASAPYGRRPRQPCASVRASPSHAEGSCSPRARRSTDPSHSRTASGPRGASR